MGWISNTNQARQWSQLLYSHKTGNYLIKGSSLDMIPARDTISPEVVAVVFDGDGWIEAVFDFCQEMYKQGVFIYHGWQVVNGIEYMKYELPRPFYTPKHLRIELE